MNSRSIISTLFDTSFTSFVTPRIMRFFYLILLVMVAIGTLIFAFSGFANGFGSGLLTLIISPIVGGLYLLIVRLGVETTMAIFTILQRVNELSEAVTGQPPAAFSPTASGGDYNYPSSGGGAGWGSSPSPTPQPSQSAWGATPAAPSAQPAQPAQQSSWGSAPAQQSSWGSNAEPSARPIDRTNIEEPTAKPNQAFDPSGGRTQALTPDAINDMRSGGSTPPAGSGWQSPSAPTKPQGGSGGGSGGGWTT